jgi:hypothetical protein
MTEHECSEYNIESRVDSPRYRMQEIDDSKELVIYS